ncbi:acd7370b-780c-40bc-8e00-17a7bafb5d7b [Thermothielavioides terrestris]|uniref:Acd7370b-780c-40bc-8e00-17a7bafb5d7b n=1 Tax=Thermothielavioides terrestris TaxID=2587410 RepID=A0A3S4BA42_9PEZI|nr:acd7370b-780c-40bc-8e00-17a7bafb5d7b [Thermothielavioides terrestris]
MKRSRTSSSRHYATIASSKTSTWAFHAGGVQAIPAGLRVAAIFAIPTPTIASIPFDLATVHDIGIANEAGPFRCPY